MAYHRLRLKGVFQDLVCINFIIKTMNSEKVIIIHMFPHKKDVSICIKPIVNSN